jgi:DNA transformation protein and related proteins
LSTSTEFEAYILDSLKRVGSVKTGRFFGGIGFSCNSLQFAMMMEERLYFVVDDNTRKIYEAVGMQAFSYATKKGRIQVRRYFEVPEEVLDNPEQLEHWAKEAISIAGKTKKSKSDTVESTQDSVPVDLYSILK